MAYGVIMVAYPSITRNRKQLKLHKLIAERMGLVGEIDHEDRNKLNCQRTNIRHATHSQNGANRAILPNNTTGFKGVAWDKYHKKFRVEIRVNWKPIFLGYFDVREEAARAYDRAAIKHFGEFASLNFPRSDYELHQH